MADVNYTPKFACWGNKRISYGTATLSGTTSGAVETGLGYVEAASLTPLSCDTTAVNLIALNAGSGGTAINGQILIASGTAGDAMSLIAIGW